jgi:hypothetical protein
MSVERHLDTIDIYVHSTRAEERGRGSRETVCCGIDIVDRPRCGLSAILSEVTSGFPNSCLTHRELLRGRALDEFDKQLDDARAN